MAHSFSSLRDAVDCEKYVNKDPYPKTSKYKEGHVFDRERSVNWNEAEVKRRNEETQLAKNAWSGKQRELTSQFEIDLKYAIIEYILAQYGIKIGDASAHKIVKAAWEEGHSNGLGNVIHYADEFSDLVGEVMSAESIGRNE